MEVHHAHSHGRKGLKDYFTEFLMIFLAVTAGFFAETLREHISDSKKEKEYMVSMIADLKEDTADIGRVSTALFRNIRGQDSLIRVLQSFDYSDTANKNAYRYYLKYTIAVPQVFFNEGTITQLLGSGNLRLVTARRVVDSIMEYASYVRFNKAQASYYNDQFKICFDYSTNIFDFTVARNPLDENFKRSKQTPIDLSHSKLLTHDSTVLQKYRNDLTMLQSLVNGYVMDLSYAKFKASHLIALLRKEYSIKE